MPDLDSPGASADFSTQLIENARLSGGFIRLRLRQSLTNEDMGEGDFGAELPDWRRLTKRQIKY